MILLTVYPHNSHNLKPLHNGFYGPLKVFYNQVVNNWMVVGKPLKLVASLSRVAKSFTFKTLLNCVKSNSRSFKHIMKVCKVTGFFLSIITFSLMIFSLAASLTDRSVLHKIDFKLFMSGPAQTDNIISQCNSSNLSSLTHEIARPQTKVQIRKKKCQLGSA